jgi:AhpD family alkylhydroperoxidase
MAKRRIVLGLDGSRGADAARDWCVQYAPLLDAEVIAVHVLGASPDYMDRRQSSRVLLQESVAPLRERGIEHRIQLLDGSPPSALDRFATQEKADLIVVGHRGTRGFVELLLGSMANVLAHHAHSPVLIAPLAHQGGVASATISVVKGCEGCIAHHARRAAPLGATEREVAEILAVALLMDGGPATVHGPRAWDAFLEFQRGFGVADVA